MSQEFPKSHNNQPDVDLTLEPQELYDLARLHERERHSDETDLWFLNEKIGPQEISDFYWHPIGVDGSKLDAIKDAQQLLDAIDAANVGAIDDDPEEAIQDHSFDVSLIYTHKDTKDLAKLDKIKKAKKLVKVIRKTPRTGDPRPE